MPQPSPSSLTAWLEENGILELEQTLQEQGFKTVMSIVESNLTDADLRLLGIEQMKVRKDVLRALAKLGAAGNASMLNLKPDEHLAELAKMEVAPAAAEDTTAGTKRAAPDDAGGRRGGGRSGRGVGRGGVRAGGRGRGKGRSGADAPEACRYCEQYSCGCPPHWKKRGKPKKKGGLKWHRVISPNLYPSGPTDRHAIVLVDADQFFLQKHMHCCAELPLSCELHFFSCSVYPSGSKKPKLRHVDGFCGEARRAGQLALHETTEDPTKDAADRLMISRGRQLHATEPRDVPFVYVTNDRLLAKELAHMLVKRVAIHWKHLQIK
jgi:hypothetical protein